MQHKLNNLILASIATLSAASHAEVTQFQITETSPAYQGRSFGAVGALVRITAKATIALDPADPRNKVIADIALAPRNAAGKVTAVADVVLIKPLDASKGNGTLLVDVPNRGRKLSPQLFDDATQPGANNADLAADAGIGFAARQGYTQAWIGWQGDIASEAKQLALLAPSVVGVTGAARDEFQFDHLTNPANTRLSSLLADPASLKVTVRQNWADARQSPAGLAIVATGPQTVAITRPAGFDAGALYEVTYTAKDPVVYGMGFAAMRDVAAFLRNDSTAMNPLASNGANPIKRSIGFGVSQSGRFLRDFLWLGFNQDLAGKAVFDGLMPHVAGARRMATNFRFGQPSRNARHPQDPAWQLDLFPFTYEVTTDPVTGLADGLLAQCRLSNTCPKVIQTDSEHEWWASRASLVVTDPSGFHLEQPSNVRAFMLSGTPHYADPFEKARRLPTMALPVNPLQSGPAMRALLAAMQAWISTGQEPPASRTPSLAQGTLVPAARAMPVTIPGLPYEALHTLAAVSDQGSLPPKVLGYYPVFVPLADADGMAVGGLRALPLAVPRASYTGWNPRATGFSPGNLFPLQGAAVAFAATKAARLASGDPRLSIEERYASHADYVAAVKAMAGRYVRERVLLAEDAERAVAAAEAGALAQLQ
jgi:Alpha/beta hydrolase domain